MSAGGPALSGAFGDFVELELRWRDETRYGSALSARLHDTVRQRLYPGLWGILSEQMRRPPGERRRYAANELARTTRQERQLEAHQVVVADRTFWRPDPALVTLAGLGMRCDVPATELSLPLADGNCGVVREWLRGGATDNFALMRLAQGLETALAAASFRRPSLPSSDRGPMMVGHACVAWSDGEMRLWTDPFLRPKRLRYPLRQQPISPLDTPELHHTVLLTHSHPDHFSPASLLLFPQDTTIVVPPVECESPLALDLGLRAIQLGFTDVRQLAWGEQLSLGRFVITAFPFYGEQPLGPHAAAESADRNEGSIYHVRGPGGQSAVFLADSGSDPAGSALQLARDLRRTVGPVDFVFGNHRRWRLYPPQYITTSVPQNLCYVPDAELEVPQAIMLTPEELQAIGAVLSARAIVPYAMGNAPWFTEIGLGPAPGAPAGAFDSPLETAEADDPNTLVTPTAEVWVLAPGEGIDAEGAWRHGDFEPIDPVAFGPHPNSRPTVRAMAIGGARGVETVRDLLELTRIEPGAYLIAAPGFVEIVGEPGRDLEFLWDLATRLVPGHEWIAWSALPMVGGVFTGAPAWLVLFEVFHGRASRVIRSGGGLDEIRDLVDELSAGVPGPAIATIAEQMLGIALAVREPHQPAPEWVTEGWLELPLIAEPLIAAHGRAAVTRALLVVKLIHNIVLTLRAIGYLGAGDESAVFAALLAPRPEGIRSTISAVRSKRRTCRKQWRP